MSDVREKPPAGMPEAPVAFAPPSCHRRHEEARAQRLGRVSTKGLKHSHDLPSQTRRRGCLGDGSKLRHRARHGARARAPWLHRRGERAFRRRARHARRRGQGAGRAHHRPPLRRDGCGRDRACGGRDRARPWADRARLPQRRHRPRLAARGRSMSRFFGRPSRSICSGCSTGSRRSCRAWGSAGAGRSPSWPRSPAIGGCPRRRPMAPRKPPPSTFARA